MFDIIAQIDPSPAGIGVLVTGLLLGIRHGIDWDHIAAITDITSTTAAATAAEAAHAEQHRGAAGHRHGHGGTAELQAHGAAFDGARYAWRRLQARFHGHEHVEPLEMSSYGTRTALGVGMIHGIGAETGTQVLLIAAVGGAASAGLGIPMLLAFVLGLLISNFAIVVVSSVGFVASQTRELIYVAVGAVAGLFSLVIGAVFLLGMDAILPDLESMLPF